VKNTGNVDLSGVTLNDNVYGAITVPGTLAAGASYTAYHTGAWQAGQHTNTATASGSFKDDAGNTQSPSDKDDANYWGVSRIDISGVKVWDRDGDGAKGGINDVGDQRLAGLRIYLDQPTPGYPNGNGVFDYLDVNKDGTFNALIDQAL